MIDVKFEFPKILLSKTSDAWLDYALKNIDILLIDHALCEKKAALSAISMLYSYGEYEKIILNMPKLAREELRHFEMVVAILRKRGVEYKPIRASRYASSLYKKIASSGEERFLDQLVLAAFIEARSYERFAALSTCSKWELADFYRRLCHSEWRHYLLFIDIAKEYFSHDSVEEKILLFAKYEAQLIDSTDSLFRVHSGVPF
ncbi:MAG: tRNA-(ms[2]io[6]A)-hydroxylase [Legionellales bacterium]|jgi:tRNA 2-(methylsulfanyl)-N6-isopentenyladenosine37 hydroxylase|nr:tRNA-(ms[2]io[6]A)-hydroxylase [Legionellales bacterium]